jgi:acyl-CoA hydrolase
MRIPPEKLRTPAAAAALVADRDSLGLPLGPGQPGAVLEALGERERFEDLQVFSALLMGLYPLFIRPGVHLRSGFFGPVERGLRASGYDVEFVPADFRRFIRVLEDLRPRVMATAAAPPDDAGRMSLSLHAGATFEELRRCGRDPERLLIVEVNADLPWTLGMPPEAPHWLDLDEVDVIVESSAPVPLLGESEPTRVEERIAERAIAFVPEGATLQTGIGGIPSRVASLLAARPGGDYGIHSEMFTDGLMHLHDAGKVSNARKGMGDGVSICTFAGGSAELVRWLDRNPLVRFLPVDQVNAPERIAANRHMVSINGALSVDLFGQVAADVRGGQQFSGVGGHEDFVAGPGLEAEDRSLICLPSVARVEGRALSRIVAGFGADAVVTTPRHQVDIVITEHGAAELAGRSVEERAAALLEIADPEFRHALRAEWEVAQKRG